MRFKLLIPLLMLFACRQSKEADYLLPSKYASDRNNWQMSIDTVMITRPEGYNNRYYTHALYMQGDTAWLAGFNPGNQTIDILDISRRKVVTQIQLTKDSLFAGMDKQDMNKSKSITDILFINFDSILVNIGNNNIVLTDTALRIKKVINLREVAARNGIAGIPVSNSGNFSMIWQANTKSILLNQLYADDSIQVKRPIMTWLNLETLQLQHLPLSFSDYYYSIDAQAGFLGQIYVSRYQSDTAFTYSYGYESNIYQYNARRGTITYYGAQSDSCSNLVTPFVEDKNDSKSWEIHMIENTSFQMVLYDPYRHLYYRFHARNIPYRNGKYFHGLADKPLVLMVFNNKFELIREVALPEHVYAAGTWFITPEGLYLSPAHIRNRNVPANAIPFHIFKLKQA